MKSFSFQTPLGTKNIGLEHPVFVIAEAGSNWSQGSYAKYSALIRNGFQIDKLTTQEKKIFIQKWFDRDIMMAKALIDVAVEAGADAVKFQTYRAETVYVAGAGTSDYLEESGYVRTINEVFEDLSMPYELIETFANYCTEKGILFMSSGFSKKDVDAVDPFTSIHKIASYELGHVRLMQHILEKGKPIIFSSGAAKENEIKDAIELLRKKTDKIVLMQCTAKYPAQLEYIQPEQVLSLAKKFNILTGLSDHSREKITAAVMACAYGAAAYEVHYTLHNSLPGPDHPNALTPEELKETIKQIRQAERARKTLDANKLSYSAEKTILEGEKELREYAVRGIQAVKDIKKGETFQEADIYHGGEKQGNIAILRPGKKKRGIQPKHIDAIIGKVAKRDIKQGDGIQEEDFQ